MEDLQNALKHFGLAVKILPDKGRSLFTTRDFSPGDVIISQEPYVSVATNTSTNVRCNRCFALGCLKRCSACHVVWYCGSVCQKSDWKLHHLECQALSKLDQQRRQSLTPSIRLMVKLCLRRKLQCEKIIPATATDNYQLVEALVSHLPAIEEKQLVLYAQMANLVNMMLLSSEIHVKEISENFSRLACNAHTICDSELRPLGTGLYPVISIINHSCLPNSVLVFEGRLAIVRAVEHLPKGSEASISYIDTAGSTMTRQKVLREQYLFNCTCSRCINAGKYDDIRESAILEGYGCKNVGCGGFLLRDSGDREFECQQCGLVRNKEEIKQTASKLKLISNTALKYTSSHNFEEATSTYKLLENLQSGIYHPLSINLMRSREAILKNLMELKDWREALAYCRLTIPVYERVYPGFHPLLGLQYYTRGKLEWLLGETEYAVHSLTKAVKILSITHGTNTDFMKSLMIKLEEARAEASYKLLPNEEYQNPPRH